MTTARLLEIFAYLILGGLFSLLLTFGSWVWWFPNTPRLDGMAIATVAAIVHPIMCYETGFKKGYKEGKKKYFYVVWFAPTVLSLIGFAGLICCGL